MCVCGLVEVLHCDIKLSGLGDMETFIASSADSHLLCSTLYRIVCAACDQSVRHFSLPDPNPDQYETQYLSSLFLSVYCFCGVHVLHFFF